MTVSVTKRRIIPLLVVAVVSAVALAAVACGGTSSSDKTKTAVAGGGASTTAAPTAAETESASEQSAYATQTAAAGSKTPAAATTAATGGGAGAAMVLAKAVPAGSALKDETGATLTQYLTDGQGNTLYYFKPDVAGSGKSSVPANIAANWPPLTTTGTPVAGAGVTGPVGTFVGSDGGKWVLYKGKPLYYFKGDAAPGDTKGEGLGGIWFVVGP